MIVVVGGRGLIGGAIVDALGGKDEEVVVGSHDEAAARLPCVRYLDMLEPDTLPPAVEGARVVVQSANFPTYPREKPSRGHVFEAFDQRGTRRLVGAAEKAGVERYVFVSGVDVRPGTEKRYYDALWKGERRVLESDMAGVCLRPTLVFGPGDRALNQVVSAARFLPAIPVVGDGQQRHDPVFAPDVGQAGARCTEEDGPTGVFEVGGADRMSLDEMLRITLGMAGRPRPILHVPHRLARAGASVLKHLPGTPLTPAAVDFIAEDFVADLQRAQEELGFSPTPFREGLSSYMDGRMIGSPAGGTSRRRRHPDPSAGG